MAEYHTTSGKLADPEFRHRRARKAANARTAPSAHIAAIVAAAGKLTPEDIETLRAILPPAAKPNDDLKGGRHRPGGNPPKAPAEVPGDLLKDPQPGGNPPPGKAGDG